MHRAAYDGQPVSYPQYTAAPQTLGEYCAAQSAVNPFDFLGDEFPYSSSPVSQDTPSSEQILTPAPELPLFPAKTDYSPYPCQQQLQQGPHLPATPSTKRLFLTPPPSASYKLEKTDSLLQLELSNFSPSEAQSDAYYSLSSAVVSPPNWIMSDNPQLSNPHFNWEAHANMQNRSMGNHAPSYGDQLPRQMPNSTYGGPSFHLQQGMGTESVGPVNDETIVSHLAETSPVPSIHEESPHEKGDVGDSFQFDDEDTRPLPMPAGQPEEPEGTKTSVPYAQLLRKAFISVPDKKMKLQQIYQWFRDNTDKANNDSKGWQNSIRHNLSMNAAFMKCECKSGDPQETKKSTEWKLSDWAFRDGVQSTTRYRKGNPVRRCGPSHHISGPARASLGRKGGPNTNKTRTAGPKRSILSRPADQELLNRHVDTFQGPVYNRPLNYNYGSASINGHATPSATDWMGRPIYSGTILPTPNGELNTYAYNSPSHNQTMGGLPPREHTQAMYPTADIVGSYGGSQLPPNTRVHDQHMTLSPRYSEFFPNPQEPVERPNYFAWNPTSGGSACP